MQAGGSVWSEPGSLRQIQALNLHAVGTASPLLPRTTLVLSQQHLKDVHAHTHDMPYTLHAILCQPCIKKKKITAQALWTEMCSCQGQLLGILQYNKQRTGPESCQENDTPRKSAPAFFFLGVNTSDDKPESGVWKSGVKACSSDREGLTWTAWPLSSPALPFSSLWSPADRPVH